MSRALDRAIDRRLREAMGYLPQLTHTASRAGTTKTVIKQGKAAPPPKGKKKRRKEFLGGVATKESAMDREIGRVLSERWSDEARAAAIASRRGGGTRKKMRKAGKVTKRMQKTRPPAGPAMDKLMRRAEMKFGV